MSGHTELKGHREVYHAVLDGLAKQYGVKPEAFADEVAVSSTIQQKLETEITESDEFLKSITSLGVPFESGAKVGVSFTGFIGKRTNTKAMHDRKAIDPHGLDESRYLTRESEYDTMIHWATLDTWAKFRDFYRRWRAGVTHQIALNRIQVGFYGQFSKSETSNAGYAAADDVVYDMGQDFHQGWIAYALDNAGPDKVMGINPETGEVESIKVGPGGDYENLDALVLDLVHEKLPRQYRNDPAHRAMIGSNLYHQEVMRLYSSNGDTASEKKPLDAYVNQHSFGKKRTRDVPFFPEGGLIITPPANFAHYHLLGSHYRSIENNKHRKCIEDMHRFKEDFVITNLDNFCMVHPDALQVKNKDGEWVQATPETWAVEIPADALAEA